MNSAVGRFALAKHRFTKTKIAGIEEMYSAMQSPFLKGFKNLRNETFSMDPLSEIDMRCRRVTEDLSIHVQIQVYQNSKLLFFKFL